MATTLAERSLRRAYGSTAVTVVLRESMTDT
jgi:hypothetical protein